jgi:5-methylcytosine-specific restriction endonuclease McrA
MAFMKGNQYAKGSKHTDEWKEKARLRMLGNTHGFTKGKPSPRKGKKATLPAWNKGIKMPERSGANHHLWTPDRTKAKEKRRLRMSFKWREWRTKIFERDSHTCKECGISGVYIEPHHIIPIREDESKVFDIGNGITLCRPCHKKTMWKELDFVVKYQGLLN